MTGAATVQAIPDFSNEAILRPYSGFESDYQGQSAAWPILFSESGKAYDELAEKGEPGYDPNLVRGLKLPVGTRLVLELPRVLWGTGQPYIWVLVWRMRNVTDHRLTSDDRMPFHFVPRGDGVEDKTGANPGVRVAIPASLHSVIYNQDEPSTVADYAVQHIRAENYEPRAGDLPQPIMPGGARGAYQQGMLPSDVTGYLSPSFVPHEVQALGDELILGVYRPVSGTANWELGSGEDDENLSIWFGSGHTDGPFPNLGVRAKWGIAP